MRGDVSIQVFLTRPEGRNGAVPSVLRSLGLAVHELPALDLRPVEPPQPLPLPHNYDVVVFVSRYAVQRYLQLLSGDGSRCLQWPPGTIAATVGASSARWLIASGSVARSCVLHPDASNPAQDSEALLELLLARKTPLKRVLIVRGTQGRDWLAQTLAARGAHVDLLPLYERKGACWPSSIVQQLTNALSKPESCIFLLTSSEGVQAVAERLDELGLLAVWARAGFVIIHERIGATLQSVLASQSDGKVRRLELCMPDDESIVEAIHAVANSAA